MSYSKECTGCGESFETEKFTQKRCKPGCGRVRTSADKNRTRTLKRENHETEFIAVDGEGIDTYEYVEEFDEESGELVQVRKSVHDYVLLSVGDKSLHKDGKFLTHNDIFTFLYEQFLEHPDAAFVGFFLGYDFTMWLRSIPAKSARSLLTPAGIEARKPKEDTDRKFPWPVRDGWHNAKWEFDLLGMKRFKLRPYLPRDEWPQCTVAHKTPEQIEACALGEHLRNPYKWMYICDAGPFFQTSFLNAINPKDWTEPVCTPEEYARIEVGKEHRSDAKFDAEMLEYNLLENEVMTRLMERVNDGFMADGIRLNKNQWFGPGQAAQTWMKNIGVPTGEEIRAAVPQYARDAARKTYYGGWFEIFNHGPVPGTCHAYDINSAYPYVIATLPCLLHGKWTHRVGSPGRLPRGAYRMVYAEVWGGDRWVGPVPFRESDGSILRPMHVIGWYWSHELEAAKRAGLIKRLRVIESVTYEPCACEPPMASIRELYEGRLTVGKNTAAGKGKKLVYNSAYGKLAQSIGEPRFSNPIWASLITAGCRTMILDAIATHPTKTNSLMMIATDGIVFKEPHPTLDIHPTRLGAWDEETYENLSLFMPGLYWHDASRATIREGKSPKLKSRGVSAKHLATVIDTVDRQWRHVDADHPYPKVRLNIPWGIVTAKQAITRGAWETCGEKIFNATRVLNGKPDGKRYPHATTDPAWAWGGIRSWPYPEGQTGVETTYYDRGFGEALIMEDDEGNLVTPDGVVADLQAWAMHLR